jgi:uncharacterized membrane protein YphA (DoxX/SURF4 family)
MKKHLPLLLTALLSLTFLISGTFKLLDVSAFKNSLILYKLPYTNIITSFAFLIPALELFLSIALFSRRLNRLALWLTSGMLIFFTMIHSYGYFNNNVDSCNCFGPLEIMSSSYVQFIIRNYILIGIGFILLAWRHPVGFNINPKILAGMTAIVVLISVYSQQTPLLKLSGIKEGDRVEDTVLKEIYSFSPESTYLLYLFSTRCPHCIDGIRNINAFQENKIFSKVLGLTYAPDIASFREKYKPGFEIMSIEPATFKKATLTVPVMIIIKNNLVDHVLSRSVISPETYINHQTE